MSDSLNQPRIAVHPGWEWRRVQGIEESFSTARGNLLKRKMTAKLTSYMVIPLGKELMEISFYIEVVAGDAGARKSGIVPPGFRSGVKGMPEVARGNKKGRLRRWRRGL